ncbi:penicillin acylase family protein [Kordiimonas pumila]|uniref:Penicillin acylase family protein n=1 Tax=Kordiimonas pumila TaxID=2161677 RepID=A0ABV7D7V1_9PROT|nr:penicillin acylase family protein [Kordiimonas pumila]
MVSLRKIAISALVSSSLVGCANSAPTETGGRSVEIKWTEYDNPHITADNYEDLGFGYGYVLGKDRLCENSGRALALRGERSRVYGPDGFATVGFLRTTNLNSDLIYSMRLPEDQVLSELENLQPKTKDLIRGVTRGLNYYVETLSEAEKEGICGEEPLVEFKETDIVRSAMAFGVMKELVDIASSFITSASAWKTTKTSEVFHPNHSAPVVVESGFGSNGWAYGGNVVGSDGAMMFANPHSAWERRPHQQRIYMHQVHLTIPGEIDFAGSSFLGVPAPMTGFNKDVAWTILDAATVTPYVLQLMDVEESDDNPTYLMDGTRKPLEIRTVSREVLEKNGKVVTKSFDFAFSELGMAYKLPNGPGRPAGWYAITNANEGNASGIDQFLEAARAKNADEFVDAVADNRGILSQLLFADRYGDAGYVVAGNVPAITNEKIEECHVGGSSAAYKILDGTQSKCTFRDSDGKALAAPRSFYPDIITRGIIQNTNNSYKYTEYGKAQEAHSILFGRHLNKLSPGDKKAAGLRYDPRLIMSSIRMKEISADGVVTPEEALDVIFDNRNFAAETFLDEILALCANSTEEDVATACDVLSKWDRKNNSDSKGALLHYVFWTKAVQINSILSTSVSGDPYAGSQIHINETTAPQLVAALATSVRELRDLGFSADEPWGNALYATGNGERIPLHGGSYQEGLLNGEMPAPLTKDGFPFILFGTVYLERVQWENGEVIADVLLSHGQSENKDSEGRTAQLKLFSEKKLYRLPFTEQQLADAEIVKSVTLNPGK